MILVFVDNLRKQLTFIYYVISTVMSCSPPVTSSVIYLKKSFTWHACVRWWGVDRRHLRQIRTGTTLTLPPTPRPALSRCTDTIRFFNTKYYFNYCLQCQAKIYWNWSYKVPDLSHMGPIWPNLYAKCNILPWTLPQHLGFSTFSTSRTGSSPGHSEYKSNYISIITPVATL